MKPVQLTLHPSSALAGAFLLALCLVTLGAFTPQGSASARDVNTIAIEGQHNPRDVFFISEGTPYTVPAGKVVTLLSVTGVGSYVSSYSVELFVNSSLWCRIQSGNNAAFHELPLGLSFPAGTVLNLGDFGNSPNATVGAYLTDA